MVCSLRKITDNSVDDILQHNKNSAQLQRPDVDSMGLQRLPTSSLPHILTNQTRSPRSAGQGRWGELTTAKSLKDTAALLSGLLMAVVQQELLGCDLVVLHDDVDLYSLVVQDLLLMTNSRQVVVVRNETDLAEVIWVSTGCGGYVILLEYPEPLLSFANTHHNTWDYKGRYVMVSQRVEQVEALVATRNGKKTEHILGVVKGGQEGEWRVYMNMLYWGEGVRPVTTWRHHRFTFHSDLFPDKLADFRGAVLKASTFEFPPSIMYHHDDNGTLLYRYGEDVAIIQNLARALNFTVKFNEPADGYKWGININGSGTGMTGELLRDEVDMGVANLFLMGVRYEILTLSAPFSHEGLCFMASVEPPVPRWQAPYFPFHPSTWLAILVGIILFGPILCLVGFLSGQCGDEVSSLAKLGFSWYYAFGLLIREPQVSVPRMDSTRVFVLFLWLYSMIITIAYSTNLTAFLLVQKAAASMETIKELYESGRELTVIGEGFLPIITESTDPNLKGLAHAYKLHKGHDLDEVFDEVHEGKSVLLENTGFLHFHIVTHFTHRGVSTVRIMKECLNQYNIVIALQRNSPLKRKIDVIISWLEESGLIKYETHKALEFAATTKEYGSTGEDTKANNEEGVLALSTDHMQGLFIIAMHQNMSTQMLVYDGGSREISSYTPPLLPSTSQYRNLRNVGLSLRIGLSSPISLDTDSLSELLKTVVQRELNGCDLVFLHDDTDLYSVEVQELLLTLPNSRQVVVVRNETDLAKVVWVSPGCGGYLILMEDMEPLLYYANTYHDMWGYRGRYVMVSQRVEQVEALVATRNGKKTEHILGVVKGGQEGEWRVYMNMLYWGEGVRPVTTWRHHRFTSQSQLFPDKLSDFRGAVLKVATFEFPPSIMYYEADNGTLLYHYGEEITIVQNLAQTLNFSARFAEPADGDTWGYLINDSWTGMMGELVRNEADMGLGNVFMMGYRYEVITFSAPFSHESVCFMARVEPPVPRWQAPSFPFHPWTWLAFLVGIIVSGPILFVVAFFSGQFGAESTSLTKIGFSCYYVFGLHFREPQVVEPRMNSTRIFVLFLWLYTMILTITYSTNLTAFLLVQKPAASMETTRELYESGREMALICQGLTLSIAKSRDPYIKGLMNVYKTYKHHKLDEVFDRVLKGKSVFLENEEFLNFHIATQFTHRGVSRVRLMKECLTQYNIIIALQRNSALKRKIDIIISWVHESGLVGHENRKALEFAATTKKYGSADKEKSTNQEEGVVALSIDHMQGLFILVVLGWFVGALVFIMEYFSP
ncbi:hypothetical protein Pcinc_020906 [Petrolisthes cinctipes]|uniref:Ionotropic glutamate receptor L-glutamate and glycine-binding domain-containing protein n=1 Tax=Petrolisthes cinctipes TaxID=88211 RepID=A0AAE1KFS7_PETCI|nr:hypothetical protein Pcinc_020906 [Petrolisthes cinctipes]